jgi:hypothetical protein
MIKENVLGSEYVNVLANIITSCAERQFYKSKVSDIQRGNSKTSNFQNRRT